MNPNDFIGTDYERQIYDAIIDSFHETVYNRKPFKPTPSQQTMKTNLSIKTDYIIGSVTETGDYSFSTNPKSHATPLAANTELQRLARTIPGKQFVVFERKLTPVKTAIQTQQASEWL